MARSSTSFKPGISGNPGGGPSDRDVSALARRYTVDAISALVRAARNSHPSNASASVAAARELVAIGYPGLGKGVATGEGNALHLHLLAVTAHVAPGGHMHLTGAPQPEAPPALEAEFAPFAFDETALPRPDDDLPGEALPLWDAFKARKAAEAAQLSQENSQATPDSAESGAAEAPDSAEDADSDENPGEGGDDVRRPD
jgi:hypothetical protein